MLTSERLAEVVWAKVPEEAAMRAFSALVLACREWPSGTGQGCFCGCHVSEVQAAEQEEEGWVKVSK
jgi:hypothetical protein